MSDEALRALERDARARPDDRAAAWAYARGLERAGERRALWLELCRMSRAGDDDASRAVDGWVPGLGGTTPPVLASLRAPKVARVSLVRDEAWLNDRIVDAVLSAADGRVLLLGEQETLIGIDPRDEVVVWRHERVAALQPCGDEMLIVTRDRSALLRSAGTTEVVCGAGLVGPGEVSFARVWGDRLIVHRLDEGARRAFTQVLDLGDAFGRVLWSRDLWSRDTHSRGLLIDLDHELVDVDATGDVVLFLTHEDVSACDVDSGREVWRRPHDHLPTWWRGDRASVLLYEDADSGRTVALDTVTGDERWSATHAGAERCATLTPGRVVFEQANQSLATRSRANGQALWRADGLPGDPAAYAASPEVVYRAAVLGPVLQLDVFDLETGVQRNTTRASLPMAAAEGVALFVSIRDSTVDVVVSTPSDLVVIVRFAD